jgi:CheY-like chemotaxis protein
MFPNRTRILVVDDMPKMRQIVTSQIKSLGYIDVMNASNGKEALNLLKEEHEKEIPIEIVFSDWNMPIMAGIELLQAIRQSQTLKHLPFIMVTAEGQRDQVMAAIKFGVSNYIVKPFPPTQLELKIKAVWDRLYAKKS